MMSDTKSLIKNHLKTLPVWDHLDEFKNVYEKTQHDLNGYYKRLDSMNQRANKIPNLNLKQDKDIASNSGASNNLDIVRNYRKINGSYEYYDKEKELLLERKASRNPFKTKSVLMLEEKLQADEQVYARVNDGKPWMKCKIARIHRKSGADMTIIALKLREGDQIKTIKCSKFEIARIQHHKDELMASKRVIAGLSESNLMPGIIAEQPDVANKHRYLVFMDDGSAKYFKQELVYPILGQTVIPWEDVRKLKGADSVYIGHLRQYFSSYPKKHILQAKVGDQIELLRNGMYVPATIVNIDCNTIRLLYKDNTEESIYRGSPRLLRRSNVSIKKLAAMKNLDNFHRTLLVYMHLYCKAGLEALDERVLDFANDFGEKLAILKNTARKSTNRLDSGPKIVKVDLDNQPVNDDSSTVKNFYEDSESRSHKCSPSCLSVPGIKTETSVEDIVGEFRHVSDLKVPLLLGWKRQLQRISLNSRIAKKRILVTYEAPCGKTFYKPYDISRYLLKTQSILDMDYFSFDREINLNYSIGPINAYHYVEDIAIDRQTGKHLENKNISLINQFSEEQLPEDFVYRNESFPHPLLEKRGFSFNEDFKSSCDCESDCSQRATCACHRLNEEFYKGTAFNKGTVKKDCQYDYKRLVSQVQTGIFECNSFCSCSSRCSNRVVQNGIRFRLQVYKTLNKGWGVITLDDIPSGAFICTYSAELLDDADMYGDSDMYYADLDYITENERIKNVESDDEKSDEGVDTDDGQIVSDEKKKKGKRSRTSNDSSDDDQGYKNGDEDDGDNSSISSLELDGVYNDYMPRSGDANNESRYPKRQVQQQLPNQQQKHQTSNQRPKFKKIHDLLNSHDYTLDARMQGNVGRFFNHSCDPNSFVQNVFIESHDLRFPIVAFFAQRLIRAGTEINWNYSYKIGSLPGRTIYCNCNAPNCKGRIL